MPTYLYRHPKTHKVIEVIQRMTEEHVYVDDKGVKWEREYTVPTASIDTKIDDPFDSRAFVEKTGRKKGTMGDLWDQAREASDKRRKLAGKDELKEKSLKAWGKKRNNRKHPKLDAVSKGEA